MSSDDMNGFARMQGCGSCVVSEQHVLTYQPKPLLSVDIVFASLMVRTPSGRVLKDDSRHASLLGARAGDARAATMVSGRDANKLM